MFWPSSEEIGKKQMFLKGTKICYLHYLSLQNRNNGRWGRLELYGKKIKQEYETDRERAIHGSKGSSVSSWKIQKHPLKWKLRYNEICIIILKILKHILVCQVYNECSIDTDHVTV